MAAPADAVAGAVEAAEGAGEAGGVGEEGVFGDFDVAHDDLAGDGGAEGELAFDLGGGEAGGSLVEDEAADGVVEFGPDDEDVGDGGVGDPGFGAVEAVAGRRSLRRWWSCEPGSEPALGSVRPKQPMSSPVASLGRYFCALGFGAVGVDGEHDERGLDAHHGAVAGVDALDLAGDEAVG